MPQELLNETIVFESANPFSFEEIITDLDNQEKQTIFGILTFPDGSNYEGEWAKGFMNGKGTFTWSDGTQKTGIWKNGKLQE